MPTNSFVGEFLKQISNYQVIINDCHFKDTHTNARTQKNLLSKRKQVFLCILKYYIIVQVLVQSNP